MTPDQEVGIVFKKMKNRSGFSVQRFFVFTTQVIDA